jgi:predicted nucleotidyltransferase
MLRELMDGRSVETLFRALNDAGVRYLVVGGLAVVAHGYVRHTADIDLVVQLERKNLTRALEVLSRLNYKPKAPVSIFEFADPERRREWIEEKNMKVFSLRSEDHPLTEVDVFVREPFDFAACWENRLIQELVPGVAINFVPIETLLALKQEAGRPEDLLDIARLEIIRRRRSDD